MLSWALIMLGVFAVSDRGFLFMLFLFNSYNVLVLSQVKQIYFGFAKRIKIRTIVSLDYG